MVSIGLTGGYATGKSTVAAHLRSLGAVVVDADELAHAAIEKGKPAWEEVVAVFGREILDAGGEIDRRILGRKVFADAGLRAKLEGIIHPRVIAAIRSAREEACAAGSAVFVAEVPLLFEAGMAREFDRVWVVSAPPEIQRRLAMARDGLTEAEVASRLAAQMPLSLKENRADLVLQNDGDRDSLRRQIEAGWADLFRDMA